MRQEKMRHAAAGAAQFRAASDQSLLISFGQQITLDSHHRVLKLLHLLQAEPIEGLRNLHPAYCSLLIKFDPLRLDHDEVQSRLVPYLARLGKTPLPAPQQVEIPVCYGGEFGPDLSEVAAMHGMTPAQAVELHSSPICIVYFLGFAPGFAYLGGFRDAQGKGAARQRRNRREPDGCISLRHARRLETDRAYARGDVSSPPGPDEPFANR